MQHGRGERVATEREAEQSVISNTEWKHLRSKLHHDWLQNKYITFLRAEIAILNHPDHTGGAGKDILLQLHGWERKKGALLKFINNTSDSLSPKQLLTVPPLNKLNENDRQWLADIVHQIYLERSDIERQVNKLRDLYLEIDAVVTDLTDMLTGKRTVTPGLGSILLDKVVIFSTEISALPYDIQLTFLEPEQK
jgi:hypothetical protein